MRIGFQPAPLSHPHLWHKLFPERRKDLFLGWPRCPSCSFCFCCSGSLWRCRLKSWFIPSQDPGWLPGRGRFQQISCRHEPQSAAELQSNLLCSHLTSPPPAPPPPHVFALAPALAASFGNLGTRAAAPCWECTGGNSSRQQRWLLAVPKQITGACTIWVTIILSSVSPPFYSSSSIFLSFPVSHPHSFPQLVLLTPHIMTVVPFCLSPVSFLSFLHQLLCVELPEEELFSLSFLFLAQALPPSLPSYLPPWDFQTKHPCYSPQQIRWHRRTKMQLTNFSRVIVERISMHTDTLTHTPGERSL